LVPYVGAKNAGSEHGLSKHERLIFNQVIRTQYLVANGFQMLADDTLTTAAWKKFRAFAREKIDVISDRALAEFRSRTRSDGGNSLRYCIR
jgi:hypothetical protein